MNKKNKNKKVWVVKKGSYSDYSVIGIFSSKKNAEKISKLIEGSTVAERALDPAINQLNEGMSLFVVWMCYDGKVEKCERKRITGYNLEDNTQIWKRSKAPAYIDSIVWAKDEQHAIKIVNEKRTRLIADNKWRVDH